MRKTTAQQIDEIKSDLKKTKQRLAILEERQVEEDNVIQALEETELASALEAYTTPGHPQFDEKFDANIRKLRPDWFTK